MASSATKIGVIGVGRMGRFHVEKYLQIPECELVGVYDSNQERARQISNELGVRRFEVLDELLFEVDGVSVATSTDSHAEVVSHAIRHGLHVLVEKPMGKNLQQASEMLNAANRAGVLLQPAFLERYRFRALGGDQITQPVYFVETHRLAPTMGRESSIDVVSDLMVHDLDLLFSLIEAVPERISAVGVPILSDKVDLANVRLEFATGLVANLNASRVTEHGQRKFRVFSQDGYRSFDFTKNTVEVCTKEGSQLKREQRGLEAVDSLLEQCRDFVRAIQFGYKPLVSADKAITVLKLVEEIHRQLYGKGLARSHSQLELQ